MSRPARTDAGKEMARRLGLPKELVELCTTGSAYHAALKEMVVGREDLEEYSKGKLTEDVTKRFAEVKKDLRRITSFGSGIRAVATEEILVGFEEGVTAAAAPALRRIEGGGKSQEVADLLATTSGNVASAVAAPLATRAARNSSK